MFWRISLTIVAPTPIRLLLQVSLRRSDAGAPALRKADVNTRLTKSSGGTDYERKLETAQEVVAGRKKLDVGATASITTPQVGMSLTPRVPVAETSATAIQKVVRRRQSVKALKLADS